MDIYNEIGPCRLKVMSSFKLDYIIVHEYEEGMKGTDEAAVENFARNQPGDQGTRPPQSPSAVSTSA